MTGAIAQAGDNRLAVLAADIRQADRDVKASALTVATRAVDAGRALIEAKSLVKHGQWKDWLRGNVAMSERTAQRYMQVARSGLKTAAVALLGLRGASEAIAKHSDADKAPAYDAGVLISDITFVRECYPRSEFDLQRVLDLAENLDVLPPIEINQNNELIDGRYRLEAHKKRGMRRIRVFVTETTDRNHHLQLACRRNSSHGIPYSREDRTHQAVTSRQLEGGAAEAIARHKEPEPEDFRVHLNDSAGWPMPPPGGHVVIEESGGGFAFVWPISEENGVRYYDMLAIPSGPDRPATYLKRGGAATVVAHALARDGFALSNCDCAVFATPFDDGGMLRQWREADREFEYAKVRENWTEAQRAAHAVRRAARRAGVALSALSATDGSSEDDWLKVAAIPTETLDIAFGRIREAGGELTAKTILAHVEALA